MIWYDAQKKNTMNNNANTSSYPLAMFTAFFSSEKTNNPTQINNRKTTSILAFGCIL